MSSTLISLPKGAQPDTFWKHFFDQNKDSKRKIKELSFHAKKVTPEPGFITKHFLNKLPTFLGDFLQTSPEEVTVTMKDMDPDRWHIDEHGTLTLYSSKEEVDPLREMGLDNETVGISYVLMPYEKRHKVCFHIGNLTQLQFN